VKDADGASASDSFLLTVNPVNDAPVAANDAYTTNEDTALTIAAPGVLGNDTDVDVSDTRTAVLVAASGPASGTLTLNADGSFTYTPGLNFNGTDSFTYQAKDAAGAPSNIATVTITVNAVNDLPTISDVVTQTVNEDTPTAALAFTVSDVETAGSGLTVTATSSNATLVPAANIVLGGTGANRTVTITPAATQSGTATITLTVKDANGGTASDSFVLTVNPVNDAPVAANDAYTTSEDTALNIAAPGLLANDTDVDSAALTAVVVAGPTNGTLTLNANGSFSYTPKANFNGSDSFTYKANDGALDSNIATVTITVTAVNDAPVAVNDTYTTSEDTALNIAAPGILGNDTDVDSGTLTAVIVVTTTHGTVTVNANGSFAYTPAANYNGPDSFT
jgi:large repetitive protein